MKLKLLLKQMLHTNQVFKVMQQDQQQKVAATTDTDDTDDITDIDLQFAIYTRQMQACVETQPIMKTLVQRAYKKAYELAWSDDEWEFKRAKEKLEEYGRFALQMESLERKITALAKCISNPEQIEVDTALLQTLHAFVKGTDDALKKIEKVWEENHKVPKEKTIWTPSPEDEKEPEKEEDFELEL